MKKFTEFTQPVLTVMVQADNPDRIEQLVDASLPEGAEAFGMQFCRLKKEFRNRETYRRLFAYAGPRPVYATNYRSGSNTGLDDDALADGLLELAECGASLCDVVGDLFDRQPDELARDAGAVEKQRKLIDDLHSRGAQAIMSSHVMKFTSAERVLEMALEQQRRGADICKIVVGADSMEQQVENLRIVLLLKEQLSIPFLFLSGGKCGILRRIGGTLGCSMILCVHEYDALATPAQPLLRDAKAIRDLLAAQG